MRIGSLGRRHEYVACLPGDYSREGFRGLSYSAFGGAGLGGVCGE